MTGSCPGPSLRGRGGVRSRFCSVLGSALHSTRQQWAPDLVSAAPFPRAARQPTPGRTSQHWVPATRGVFPSNAVASVHSAPDLCRVALCPRKLPGWRLPCLCPPRPWVVPDTSWTPLGQWITGQTNQPALHSYQPFCQDSLLPGGTLPLGRAHRALVSP